MNPKALQAAVYDTLVGDSTLLSMLSGAWGFDAVFSDTPQENADDNAYYPFISFGPGIALPFDTKTSDGGSELVQINVWTRENDYADVKEIAQRVYQLLHNQSLTIAGCDHILTKMQDVDFTIDPDGHTRRGLMFFRIIYDNQ
jgi:hypothetical protein